MPTFKMVVTERVLEAYSVIEVEAETLEEAEERAIELATQSQERPGFLEIEDRWAEQVAE